MPPTPKELDLGRFFRPQGTAVDALYAKDREFLYSGPAGTGKSRTILEKLNMAANKYPGCRILITRKTRASLTESTLVTWENHVIPAGHPILFGASGHEIQRQNRKSYRYPNGSEVVLGGMDKPTRILSTEYDIIYVPEAIELGLGDWETLMSRLRNNRIPYQQMIADTNPDADTHWLYQRCLQGRTRMIESRHEDNPVLFNARKGAWTEFGEEYLSTLDRLTGARKQRLRYGRWVGAEGVVYDEYDSLVHSDNRESYPGDWMRVWVVDFGFVNPFVWQCWAVDHDGRMYREREIYRSRVIVEDIARWILQATADLPAPRIIVCDHDAEDRATLERHLGQDTVAAVKNIKGGIEAVKERMRIQPDGRPRISFGSAGVFCPDSAASREFGRFDPEMRRKGAPACTQEEFNVYVWEEAKDVPVKKHDHGMDATRYAVMAVDAYCGIEPESSMQVAESIRPVVYPL